MVSTRTANDDVSFVLSCDGVIACRSERVILPLLPVMMLARALPGPFTLAAPVRARLGYWMASVAVEEVMKVSAKTLEKDARSLHGSQTIEYK